jgi:hypothetical protein
MASTDKISVVKKELEQKIADLQRMLAALDQVNSLSDGTHIKPADAEKQVRVCPVCFRRYKKSCKRCYCDYEESDE